MENNTPVHVSDFDKICRICLSRQEIQSIFDLKYKDTSIVSLLYSCASIHVEKDDDLPKNLCSICLQEVIKIHQFQEKCRENENALRFVLTEIVVVKEEVDDETSIKHEKEFGLAMNDTDSDSESKKITDKESKDSKSKEKNKRFICRVCSKEFTSRYKLKEHQKEVQHEIVYKDAYCTVCGMMFSRNTTLSRHMLVHTKETPYKCTICSRGFSRSDNLKRHMTMHSSCEPTNRCSVCAKSFKHFKYYSSHLKKHEMDKLAEKERPLAMEEVHERVCKICGRIYETRRLLRKHYLLAHGEKKHFCTDCGRGFVRKASLRMHLVVHTGEKPHTCSTCKKSFAHFRNFKKHLLIHTRQKPHTSEKKPLI